MHHCSCKIRWSGKTRINLLGHVGPYIKLVQTASSDAEVWDCQFQCWDPELYFLFHCRPSLKVKKFQFFKTNWFNPCSWFQKVCVHILMEVGMCIVNWTDAESSCYYKSMHRSTSQEAEYIRTVFEYFRQFWRYSNFATYQEMTLPKVLTHKVLILYWAVVTPQFMP